MISIFSMFGSLKKKEILCHCTCPVHRRTTTDVSGYTITFNGYTHCTVLYCTHQFKDISVILSQWYHISWNWADCDTYLTTSSWGSMLYTIIMSRASACSQPAFRNLSFCTHAADLLWDDSRTSGCLFLHKLNTGLPECPENSRPPHLPRSTGDAAGSRSSPGQIDRSCSPGCTWWVTADKESQHEMFRNHGWWKLQIGEHQVFYKHTFLYLPKLLLHNTLQS